VRVLAWGGALTAAVTVVLWLVWGRSGVVPGLLFGSLATTIQTIAVLVVRPYWDAPFEKFAWRWLLGIALRFLGVVAIVVAVMADRALFPPLPTALAYLGVLIPLLFTETRFLGDARNARSSGGGPGHARSA
jgi:hypothetical protein